jgi:hypothetical protein
MKDHRNKLSELTTMTSICIKRYVIRATREVVSPTISTGRIPEVTAQNAPKIKTIFYPLDSIKE